MRLYNINFSFNDIIRQDLVRHRIFAPHMPLSGHPIYATNMDIRLYNTSYVANRLMQGDLRNDEFRFARALTDYDVHDVCTSEDRMMGYKHVVCELMTLRLLTGSDTIKYISKIPIKSLNLNYMSSDTRDVHVPYIPLLQTMSLTCYAYHSLVVHSLGHYKYSNLRCISLSSCILAPHALHDLPLTLISLNLNDCKTEEGKYIDLRDIIKTSITELKIYHCRYLMPKEYIPTLKHLNFASNSSIKIHKTLEIFRCQKLESILVACDERISLDKFVALDTSRIKNIRINARVVGEIPENLRSVITIG